MGQARNLTGTEPVKLALTIIFLLLSGCGGTATPAPNGRAFLFGYYGGVNTTLPEVAGHASLAWVMGWNPSGSWEQNTATQLAQARQAGFQAIVLGLPQAYAPDAEAALAAALGGLHVQGLLENITAVYPIDEPDVNGKSEAQVVAANAAVRRAMAQYPQMRDTKLAVIYGVGSNRPGISTYDWIGFDDYGQGCDALDDDYKALKALLRVDQRLMVVPGGAAPWNQSPGCFLAKAQQDAQVVAVVAFLWIDAWNDITRPGVGSKGIRSNGMAGEYIEAGRIAKGGA